MQRPPENEPAAAPPPSRPPVSRALTTRLRRHPLALPLAFLLGFFTGMGGWGVILIGALAERLP